MAREERMNSIRSALHYFFTPFQRTVCPIKNKQFSHTHFRALHFSILLVFSITSSATSSRPQLRYNTTTMSFLDKPITNKNHVPAMIEKIAAAKRAGAFTFQAGKADKVVNLAIGAGLAFVFVNSMMGVHSLAHGYGKKEGF